MEECPTCEKQFAKKVWNQKYCCSDCKRKQKYDCAQCGKSVIRSKKGSGIKFCSMVCANIHSGRTSERNCLHCGNYFTAKTSSLKYGYGKYCCKGCSNADKIVTEKRDCVSCGTSFEVAPSSTNKHCTAKCSFKSQELKVSASSLSDDYLVNRMTAREMASKYGTSKTSILRALRRNGIPIRTVSESRMPEGYEAPSKEVLEDLYWGQWLSYVEIAELYDVDMTTVPYWIKSHGIKTRVNSETRLGKDFEDFSKEKLEDLYVTQGFNTSEIGKMMGCGSGAVSARLHANGIPVRPNIYNGGTFKYCTNGLKVRSNYERYFANLLVLNGIDFKYEARLPFDRRYATDFLVGDVYVEVWGVTSNKKYEERRIKKTKLYKKNGLKLLEVYPEDFHNLADKINELKRLIS